MSLDGVTDAHKVSSTQCEKRYNININMEFEDLERTGKPWTEEEVCAMCIWVYMVYVLGRCICVFTRVSLIRHDYHPTDDVLVLQVHMHDLNHHIIYPLCGSGML
jgi:hypothetical protein